MNQELFNLLSQKQQVEVRDALFNKYMDAARTVKLKPVTADINPIVKGMIADMRNDIENGNMPDDMYEILGKYMAKRLREALK